MGRPRRGAARRSRLGGSAGLPSAVHYVGYVEDDETPEMIMKKFEALERVKQAVLDKRLDTTEKGVESPAEEDEGDGMRRPGATEEGAKDPSSPSGLDEIDASRGKGDNDLDESDLLEVFKQTSLFSVKSAQTSNELLMDYEGHEDMWDDDLNASDFELDEDEFWGGLTFRKKRRGTGSSRGSRGGVPYLRRTVTVLNKDTGVYVQKKVRVVDHTLPQLMRIPPPPVPLSWCRSVKPYRKRVMAPEPDCRVVREGCIAEMNFNALRREETYVAVLINPDWVVEESDDETMTDRLHCLKRVPLTKLCPTGFVFIWIDKGDVQKVCELMHRQNYVYVENLTWVQMLPNNKMIHGECKYTRKCHSTLYIFRRHNEGKDIELRHQRNPDVVLDCLRTSIDGHKKTPDETYKAIETLLPSFEGRALELWSSPDGPRKGWTHVVENLEEPGDC
ncbi:hypothetical protein HOP50_04g30100 [Chloropicon primus]|uniref:Uncharacterized protein n=1 Tax=Chloropicon primus TaxID=1764295 RepID=A0A5B8MMB1_9CHLO|nr:hypothetical protein A3770_04p30100 [Chloropicon primus]UPQ99702.1 hypothetical protein HOP50_04g30100 [Chloropicon primus]|eukprot:QDZ20492.1 hypothetical protein A3770_04p30100 [Chloropicon primus]